MWIIVGLPMLTVLLAAAVALVPAAHRLVWPLLALAALNVALSPITSGEWFYQRSETPDYRQAVVTGDFTTFRELLGRHDPSLQPKMIAIAVVLMVAVAMLALMRHREHRGKATPAVARIGAAGLIVLAGFATAVQAHHLAASGLLRFA
jgi:hypothetical protein